MFSSTQSQAVVSVEPNKARMLLVFVLEHGFAVAMPGFTARTRVRKA
jgi:hypothetical protein